MVGLVAKNVSPGLLGSSVFKVQKSSFNFEKDSQLENGNWYYSEDYEGARKVETDLLHWAFSGTAFYRMYELTNENRYLDLARIVTESIVNKHVTSEYKITDNSSHKWGVPETIILLKYSFFIDDDPIFLKVFDAMQEDIGPNGEYLPALDLNIYPSDIEFNHRTNSWFAYSLGFLPNLFSK